MVGNRGTARPTNEINILDEVAQPQQPALPLTSNFNTQADEETFAAIARTVGLTERQTTIADETRANMDNAHVHGNSVAGGRRIRDGAVEAAAQDQNTPEAKKRKDIEAILRAAQRDLDEWIAQMDEILEELRSQLNAAKLREAEYAANVFEANELLEDIRDGITPEEQERLNRLLGENAINGKSREEIQELLVQYLISQDNLREQEANRITRLERDIERYKIAKQEMSETADYVNNAQTPEERQDRIEELTSRMQAQKSEIARLEGAIIKIEDPETTKEITRNVENARDQEASDDSTLTFSNSTSWGI